MKLDVDTGSFYLAMLDSDKTATGKAIEVEREGNVTRITFELEDSILAPVIETLHFKQLMLIINMAGSLANDSIRNNYIDWVGYAKDSEPFRFTIWYKQDQKLYILDRDGFDLEGYDLRFSLDGWREFSSFLWQSYTALEIKKSLESIDGVEVTQ